MKVFVLCGGFGSRLAGVSADLPKPMTPVGGRPMLWHIMMGLSNWGFRDFVLCLGYRSDIIRQYFMNLSMMVDDVTIDFTKPNEHMVTRNTPPVDWRITFAETGYDVMTGARIKRAAKFLSDEDDVFGVTYGDGLTDLDFRNVVAFHRAHGKLATVTAVHPPGRFVELSLGTGGSVRAFNEKPQAESGWISGGFFVFDRRVLDLLSDDPALMLEKEPLRELARRGELVAYQHGGFWMCVDTPRDYRQLTELWQGGSPPWVVWKQP